MNADTNPVTLEAFEHWDEDPAVIINTDATEYPKTTLYQALLQAFGEDGHISPNRFCAKTGFFLAVYLDTGWKLYQVDRPNASMLTPTQFTNDWKEDEQRIASASHRQVWVYEWKCNYNVHTCEVTFDNVNSEWNCP